MREILNLNSKKAGTFEDILTKLLIQSPGACNSLLTGAWNSESSEKQYFQQNSKLAPS